MTQRISATICRFVCLASLMLMALPAWSEQNQIENELRPLLQNKVVVLQNFYVGSKLRYGPDGSLLENSGRGYWSSDGLIEISTLKVDKSHTLVVKGLRVVGKFDKDSGRIVHVRTKVPVTLLISLDPSWQDSAQVQNLLGKVIATDVYATLAGVLPEYWKCWLFGKIKGDKEHGWKCSMPESQTIKSGDLAKAYKVGGGVTPPQILVRSNPHFTEIAKKENIQGTTVLLLLVDEFGSPHCKGIDRPLGAGLDDLAIEGLKDWHFYPATLNGKPVAVYVDMEVNFRLY